MKKRPWLRWALFVVAFLLALPFSQLLYFAAIYTQAPAPPPHGLVLVYSGVTDRLGEGLAWAKADPAKKILCSGWDYSLPALSKITGLPPERFILENKARTTDQNARYSRPLILATGEKRTVLALPWYHLPRALFLTRLYLLDTDISVTPYATVPAPEDWWKQEIFHLEIMKFWGSLGRIVLSWFGIDDWPRPKTLTSP